MEYRGIKVLTQGQEFYILKKLQQPSIKKQDNRFEGCKPSRRRLSNSYWFSENGKELPP